MRWRGVVAILMVVTTASAQHEAAPPPKQPGPPPVHAPHPMLPPAAALAHVRTGNQRAVAARADDSVPHLLARPAGAGRFVVAVITCADAAVDVPALLGLRADDVLVLSNAGANADTDAVELLEWAASTERLSLCIVLTHADCRSLEPRGDKRPDRSADARDLADRRHLPLPVAQALLQRERLLAASDLLRRRTDAAEFFIAPASVDPRTGALTWHTSRAEEMPLAPVK